ncbi:peptidoglycan recognition protein [Streptomyces sp. NBC_01210]|uniref:peptidoglycan recognition protein family protein n=1 Tax=Streptomyces sp. NBC_01210 TaxID=2903774 RepID=UPI002E1174D7|nr:peptidoglycan recognition protein [Streptomyces sp. NBC_01210]
MTIDRRMLLRGMGRATAAGVIGAALAAGNSGRPPTAARAERPTRPRPRPATPWATAQPAVVPRAAWETHPMPPHRPELSATTVTAVFIHHTNSGNDYSRREVPNLIRFLSDDHMERRGWDDVGYNFFVDRTGTIYEGRSGGIANPVVGAHTLGFNVGTVGIAAIGSYGSGSAVPAPMLEGIARLAAWKLGLYGVDPRGTTTLVSTNDGSKYPKGKQAVFHTISGHCDGYWTRCPGSGLYTRLPQIRERAARLQGRTDAPAARADVPS